MPTSTEIVHPSTYGFEAMHEGTSESGDNDSIASTVQYFGPWANRWDFVRDALGTHEAVGLVVFHRAPMQYPASANPLNLPLYANGFAIEPRGKNLGDPNVPEDDIRHEHAVVTLNFAKPKYDVETWMSESISMGVDVVTLPESGFKFVSDGKPLDADAGKTMCLVEHSVTRHFMPYKPGADVRACIGKVNNAPYTIFGTTYDTGHLLFAGVEMSRDVDTLGQFYYDWEHRFAFRDEIWNRYLRPDNGAFDDVVDNNGNPPYASADFSILL